MAVTAHYDRYGGRLQQDFDSIDAALRHLAQEQELGNLAPLQVVADGRTIEGSELRRLLRDQPVFSRDFLGDWAD